MPASDDAKLVVDLEARIKDFERNFKKANRTANDNWRSIEARGQQATRRVNANMQSVSSNALKAAGGIKAFGASLAGAFAGGFAVGGLAQLPRLIRGVVGEVSKIGKVADKVGLTTEALQELRYAADLSGVAANALDMGMQRFSRRIAEAAAGTGVLLPVLKANGIALRDNAGRMRPLNDLLNDYADLIKNAGSEQERLRLAFLAFDSEGAALVNTLKNGAAGLEKVRQEARDLGGVLEDDLVRQAEEVDDAFARLQTRLTTMAKREVLTFFDDLNTAAEELSQIGNAAADAWERFENVWNKIRRATPEQIATEKLRAQLVRQMVNGATPEDLGNWITRPDPNAWRTAQRFPPRGQTVIPTTGEGRSSSGAPTPVEIVGVSSSYIDKLAHIESGGDPNASATTSSASGLYGFTDGTWLATFKRYAPEMAKGMTDAMILGLKSDTTISRQMAEHFTNENAEALRKAGFAATDTNLYAAHFLGIGDALKVLSADASTALEGLISSASIRANQSILGGGKTAGDVLSFAARKTGEASPEAIAARKETTAAAQAQAAAINQVLNALRFESDQLSRNELQQRIYQELQAAGVDINSEAGRAIATEVEALYSKEQALNDVTAAQENANARAQEFNQIQRNFAGTFLHSIKDGVPVVEALSRAIDQLTDRLLDLALDSLFSGGGLGGGGFFAGIGKLLGFDQGGFTGHGGTDRVAGVVHGREFVVNAAQTAKHRKLLEAINAGKVPGFKSGGFVGRGSVQPGAAAAGAPAVHFHVHGVQDAASFRRSAPQMMAEAGLQAARMARRNG
jgi:hypothetical protein